jgi:hypothetical protein
MLVILLSAPTLPPFYLLVGQWHSLDKRNPMDSEKHILLDKFSDVTLGVSMTESMRYI